MVNIITTFAMILAASTSAKATVLLEYWKGTGCEGVHIDSWSTWEHPDGYPEDYCSTIPEKDEFQSFIFRSTNGEKLQLFYHPTCGRGTESQIFEADPGCVSLIPGKYIASSLKVLGASADLQALSTNKTINYA